MFGEIDPKEMEMKEERMSEEDKKTWKLIKDLSDGFEVSRFGLMGM